ncbi:MAG: hypothetical protein R3C49_08005 [Planctomycetaceae bacterium]
MTVFNLKRRAVLAVMVQLTLVGIFPRDTCQAGDRATATFRVTVPPKVEFTAQKNGVVIQSSVNVVVRMHQAPERIRKVVPQHPQSASEWMIHPGRPVTLRWPVIATSDSRRDDLIIVTVAPL